MAVRNWNGRWFGKWFGTWFGRVNPPPRGGFSACVQVAIPPLKAKLDIPLLDCEVFPALATAAFGVPSIACELMIPSLGAELGGDCR